METLLVFVKLAFKSKLIPSKKHHSLSREIDP